MLKRKLQTYETFISILIISGAYTLIGFGDITGSTLGVILALISGILVSCEVFTVEKLSINKVPANKTYFWCFFISAIFFTCLIPFSSNNPSDILSFNISNFMKSDVLIYMTIYAIGFYWLANFLMYKGFERVPALHGGLILLLEPLFAVILDTTILKTELTYNMIIGGSLILLGNIILIAQASKEN